MPRDDNTADLAETHAWLTLAFTPGLGPAGCQALLKRFGTAPGILAASRADRLATPGLRSAVLEALDRDDARAAADRELEKARQQGIFIVPWNHPSYPALLKTIADPPLLLYVKGAVDLLQGPCLAVVGARAATTYGQRITEHLTGLLAGRGLTIVSGMALGIDASAHRGTLAVSGRTIGVLGCGLDVVYPPQNRRLFEALAANGTLVSEYPFGSPPDSFRFPARNRIISGLSLGVLVVEAARRSGSLITAHYALEQGREVFAIPGRVDSAKSEGSHRLLQEGAKLVHTVEDIIEELPLDFARSRADNQKNCATEADPATDLSSEEMLLFRALDVYPRPIDELIQATGLPAGKVSELLLMLELRGALEVLPGQLYQRKALPSRTPAA